MWRQGERAQSVKRLSYFLDDRGISLRYPVEARDFCFLPHTIKQPWLCASLRVAKCRDGFTLQRQDTERTRAVLTLEACIREALGAGLSRGIGFLMGFLSH
jgi:hypothetical protein